MHPIEQSSADKGESQRLAARCAIHWVEHRHLAERLAAIESSTAWAVARRLSQWRRRLLPEGSRRQWCFRLGVRGLRLWRREGIAALLRRSTGKLQRWFGYPTKGKSRENHLAASDPSAFYLPPSTAPASSSCEFRVAFIGSGAACEAQSMRYRAHNVIEALALVGLEGTFFTLEEVQAQLATILSHDLIVLVRLMHNHVTAQVIESARRLGLPTIFDIDDYLFDPWVMPYVEAFRALRQLDALRILDELGASLHECDYFTGSTSYLAEKATALGKKSFVLHNGLNAAQLRLAHQALEQRSARPRDPITRIGYFSGTRTHQADFRVVYPALMTLLREHSTARLLIVGDLDLGEFPGLLPYIDGIEVLPLRHWSELPATMASVDINLIPLEPTPFNEGKSNLKYYEAGLLKVPSIASPTRINRESITHGHNGLLARTPEEWYDCLKELMSSAERREWMGQNAFEHVLRHYAPLATATEAVEIYREILHLHRSRRLAA
jgi:glycosyltransferase involved in cell wall biosynthesis